MFSKEKNLGAIFPYTTHSKSTSIFNVIWSESQIHHALKCKSGHSSLVEMIVILLLKLLGNFDLIDFHNT